MHCIDKILSLKVSSKDLCYRLNCIEKISRHLQKYFGNSKCFFKKKNSGNTDVWESYYGNFSKNKTQKPEECIFKTNMSNLVKYLPKVHLLFLRLKLQKKDI